MFEYVCPCVYVLNITISLLLLLLLCVVLCVLNGSTLFAEWRLGSLLLLLLAVVLVVQVPTILWYLLY